MLGGGTTTSKNVVVQGVDSSRDGAISKAPPPASIGIEVYRGEVNGGEACKSKLCFCTCSSRVGSYLVIWLATTTMLGSA